MQVSRVACRASSMMKTARSPLQKTTQTKTKNRGGEARGAPKYLKVVLHFPTHAGLSWTVHDADGA